jgi:hypothetical protein
MNGTSVRAWIPLENSDAAAPSQSSRKPVQSRPARLSLVPLEAQLERP